MTIKFHTPQYPLRRFVKSMFWYEDYSGDSKYEMILPDTSPQLTIELDGNDRFFSTDTNCKNKFSTIKNSWIKGLCSQPVIFQSEQNASTLCIQFELSGLTKFLGIPVNEFTNKLINSELLLGSEIIENYLYLKFNSSLNEKCSLDDLTSLSNFSELSLDEISNRLNFSKKHTIALFKKTFGLTPKKLQLLQNVNKSLEIFSKAKLISNAEIAIECNHFDQSHFIKNFKLITTFTPKEYLNQNKIYPHVLPFN